MAAEDGGIKNLIASKVVELLQQTCIDEIASTDTSLVDRIGLRSVQQTGKERLSLIVRHMDPLRESSNKDSSLSIRSEAAEAFRNWPPAIIGGQFFDIVVGVVELKADFTRSRETPEEADAIQQKVMGRVKRTLLNGVTQIRQLEDEYGEVCHDFRVLSGEEYDSGEGTSNVGRYFLRWAALTLTASPVPIS